MSVFHAFAALWVGTGIAVAVAFLWLTREETLAELPTTADPHVPATCEVCCWASDVGVIAAIDWDLWASEMEAAS